MKNMVMIEKTKYILTLALFQKLLAYVILFQSPNCPWQVWMEVALWVAPPEKNLQLQLTHS